MEPPTGAPGAGPPPPAAAALFGDRLPLIEAYVRHCATSGVQRGLLGPREVPRLWDRHVLNCGVIAPAFDTGATVADLGSGAGLPGLVLAIARPDLSVTLIEPLERRTRWLQEVVADLGLDVVVVRAKAESVWDDLVVDSVTARAVAQLAELARLSVPLLRPGGRIVAMKGERATEELEQDASLLGSLGVTETALHTYGEGLLDPPTTVVELVLAGPGRRVREPLGDGPARTAARKKQRRRARAANRRDDAGR